MKINMEIPADIVEAETFFMYLRQELKTLPSESDRFALELLCREAVANAVEHGCRFNAEKKVGIVIEVREDCFVCRVSHDGESFAHDRAVPSAGNTLCERNHGLKLIDEYSDRYFYEENGCALVFEKHLQTGGFL